MFTYNVGLKTLPLQGLSEPEFYGDLVYKFRKKIGYNNFPYHFKQIILRYKNIGYNTMDLRQAADTLGYKSNQRLPLCLPL